VVYNNVGIPTAFVAAYTALPPYRKKKAIKGSKKKG
jgi:hypothetical protein